MSADKRDEFLQLAALRIPIRGYELITGIGLGNSEKVTNPYKGL